MTIKPPFARIGGKHRLLDKILKLIPEHDVYVEGFVGGGVIFFNKPHKPSIINDLDPDVYNRLKLLKKAPLTGYEVPDSIESKKVFFDIDHEAIQNKLVRYYIQSCCGFSSKHIDKSKHIYKNCMGKSLFNNLQLYKDLLKDTKILNKDYTKLKRYDSESTFYFLDPPYEGTSTSMYNDKETKSVKFDFIKFKDWCESLVGKVLITLNSSPYIKELFNEWIIIEHDVYGDIKKTMRPELFIMNYTVD